MAEIDPIVEHLLAGLLNSPLASYGRAAIVRLDEGEKFGELPFDVGRGRVMARRRRRAQAERQLKVIDAVLRNALNRELELTVRLQGLAERVGVKSIGVLPPETQEGDRPVGPVDQLLDPERAAAIRAFLKTWGEAVGETRQRLELEI